MGHPTLPKDPMMAILAAWDVGAVQDVVDIHPGKVYRVDCAAGTSFVLKDIGETVPQVVQRFEFEVDVLRHLDRAGLAVALPVAGRAGDVWVARDGRLYTLSPYLTTDDRWLALDLAGLTRLNTHCGAAMGKLHRALAAFPTEGLETRTWKTVFPDDLLERSIPTVQRSMARPERAAVGALLAAFTAELRAIPAHLPTQLIHRDCHHGNIIVDGEQVSGFVDYDHLSIGPRLFDLADFIVHMIKQHVADPEWTAEWSQLFPAVLQGYESEVPLLREEKQALFPMMLGILLMFAAWFYETGSPDRAPLELAAFAWMAHNGQKIRDLIMAA